jgi:hypothetical protein
MVSSKARTVAAYLAELPPERRRALEALRRVVRANLPAGYREMIGFGMIGYGVPLSAYPDTYNGHPLAYAGMAAQKHYFSLYLMGVYADEDLRKRFESAYRKSGKKLDMGKCCVRFKTVEDLPLDVIGEAIAAMPMETFIVKYETARKGARRKREADKTKFVIPGRAT